MRSSHGTGRSQIAVATVLCLLGANAAANEYCGDFDRFIEPLRNAIEGTVEVPERGLPISPTPFGFETCSISSGGDGRGLYCRYVVPINDQASAKQLVEAQDLYLQDLMTSLSKCFPSEVVPFDKGYEATHLVVTYNLTLPNEQWLTIEAIGKAMEAETLQYEAYFKAFYSNPKIRARWEAEAD